MTIKEVEKRTGLTRSNIRFYEKEKLIEPLRNESNGYRDYSEADVENIKKIAYLRTLGISVEALRGMISDKISLREVLEKQYEVICHQMTDLEQAKILCEKMLESGDITYDTFRIEQYVTETDDYWKEHIPVFRLDSVSFLYLWGDLMTWIVITGLSLGIAVLFYAKLPAEIPIQWSGGEAGSLVHKNFIFIYPAICLAFRFLLKPYLRMKLSIREPYDRIVTEYLTNYFCFVMLSVEVFTILFIYGVLHRVVAVLLLDTFVLIGILMIGLVKMDVRGK